MRDKKILDRSKPFNGSTAEDLFEAVDKEYVRRNSQPKLNYSKPRHLHGRDHKMHRQHFKWSYFINQSRRNTTG